MPTPASNAPQHRFKRRSGENSAANRLRAVVVAVIVALSAVAEGVLPSGAAMAAGAVVTDVRAGERAGGVTRLVFDLSDKVTFSVFTLKGPDRVVVDLPEVGWRLPQRPLPAGVGSMARMRYGLFKPGTSRVVLDMNTSVSVDKVFLLAPREGHAYRLVVDMKPGNGSVPATAQPAAPKPQKVALPQLPLRDPQVRKAGEKPVIVLDAGHGGVDPGAIGRSGIHEKYITLAMARALRDRLVATGRYKVVLTRNRDIFIRLRERVALARKNGGDLFLSLHADTIKDRSVRGLSVYTLSERASDKEAAMLADKENKADLIAGIDLSHESPEVTNILIDLAQRETMNQSAKLASGLVQELRREVKLLRRTHRFAGFAVLKAPDIPSVLIELGFLSNRTDEKKLKTKRYRGQLAKALAQGIDAYFDRVEEAQRSR